MKTFTKQIKIISIITILFLITGSAVFSQAPEKMSYQAVIRNSSDQLIINEAIGMQISILQGSETGAPVYVETQTPTSNANGLVSLEIGNGSVVSGDFSTIDWAIGPFYIKTESDPNGGTNYTITGTSQLMSVPYALYAKSSGSSVPYTAGAGIDISDNVIENTAPDQAVSITGSGATTVSGFYPDFTINSTDEVNDSDSDPTNEIQDISLSGNNLSISNGSTVDLSVVSNGGWSLTGNAGTNPASDFIGTTDDQPLIIKVNNVFSGKIDSTLHNTFFGYQSGNSVTGSGNTADGYKALYSNTTGFFNTANGYQALYSNTLGHSNTANGVEVLYHNTTGQNNTANGYSALFHNTTGDANTANGVEVLYQNTTGQNNTANGYQALYSNTTGHDNTANGAGALSQNTTGPNNTANGVEVLYHNTTGQNNTANGVEVLYHNTTGQNNTANGYLALHSNTTGNFNTANGYDALLGNTTGKYNTAVGVAALGSLNSGNNNTALGSFTDFNGNYNNSTALGDGATITGSNQVRIGNSAVISIGGQAGWTTLSDGRFKRNIQENVAGLNFIMKLRPVTYNLDMDAIAEKLNTPDSLRMLEAEAQKGAQLQTGFIAQEVEQSAAELGYDFSGVDAPKNAVDYYGLRYAEFVVPLVKATQEQQTLIEQQQTQIQQQQNEIDELKKLVNQLINKQ